MSLMFRWYTALSLGILVVAGCAVEAPEDGESISFAELAGALGGSGVVINEFRPGRTGWVELYNPTTKSKEISQFLACNQGYNPWPKSISAPGGTVLPAKGRITLPLAIRSSVPDGVQLFDHQGLYGPVDALQDKTPAFKLPSGSALCFARSPDGGDWAQGPVACTQGKANSATVVCTAGKACDDGDPCTTSETWSAQCVCQGAKPKNCDDANPCTKDACDNGTCKNTATYGSTACAGGTCKLGVCVSDTASPGKCTDKGGSIEGVAFTAAEACHAVAFMNGAKFSELETMSSHARLVIYDSGPQGYTGYRPANWQFVSQFAGVNLIGKTALQKLLALSTAWKAGGLWYDTVSSAYASKATGVHFTFEKVWVSKQLTSGCYEIRDTPTAVNYLTACTSPCASDSCTNATVPKSGSYAWVRGRLEYSSTLKKWLVANAYSSKANPKL